MNFMALFIYCITPNYKEWNKIIYGNVANFSQCQNTLPHFRVKTKFQNITRIADTALCHPFIGILFLSSNLRGRQNAKNLLCSVTLNLSICMMCLRYCCLSWSASRNEQKRKSIKTVLRGIDSLIGLLIRRTSAEEMKMKKDHFLFTTVFFSFTVLHLIRKSFNNVNWVLTT